MQSEIARALGLHHQVVALLWSETKPESALQFKEGKWGCVIWQVANAAKGKTAVLDRQTFGCIGGAVGLGFGNAYRDWPGGIECFYYFLSIGNEHWERGRAVSEQVKPFLRPEAYENFLHGEGYVQTPELVKQFVDHLPIVDLPAPFVVFKPLAEVDPAREVPQVVIFFADPDQLSALVVLANYDRGDRENVIIPHAAGCQTIGIFPYREARSEKPRAVVGLTDLSARLSINRLLGKHLMTFAVPFARFQEMEANVRHSFLERHTWKQILGAE